MVSEGHTIADIGTDHAYVPIHLVHQGHSPRAIAMDINRGPLKKAQNNIAIYGLGNLIETRLSNGLEKLCDDEVQTIIMAGMGGDLIVRILTEGSHALQTPKELILQPQSEWEKVRHALHQMGYRIEKEDMIEEDGKYYVAIRAIQGFQSYYDEFQYVFGDYLLRKRNSVLKEYLLKEKKTYTRIVQELHETERLQRKERIAQINQYLHYIEEALDYYGM